MKRKRKSMLIYIKMVFCLRRDKYINIYKCKYIYLCIKILHLWAHVRWCVLVTRIGFEAPSSPVEWRREWLPTPVFLPGEFHGLRSLASYIPRSRKEWDMAEQLARQRWSLAHRIFSFFPTNSSLSRCLSLQGQRRGGPGSKSRLHGVWATAGSFYLRGMPDSISHRKTAWRFNFHSSLR